MKSKSKSNIEREVPERKIGMVDELSGLIKNKRTILIASIKNLPASQFQEISKKLRGKAIIKIPKKSLIIRAIENSKNESLKEIEKYIEKSTAILFSDMDSFELAAKLTESKSPAKAKTGQEAPEDIEVQEGPTDLVPGPAISELGALGIQIQIDKGKINIKAPKVIVRKGEKISENASSLMNKLDIRPFSVGFVPLSAFDTKENILYLGIKIDKEGTLNSLKESFGKALAFAVKICHASKDTIHFILGKAAMHEKALEKLIKDDKQESTGQKNDNKEDKLENNEKMDKQTTEIDNQNQTQELNSKGGN
ncbi:50S ribosomal protein L10 [Candidatus Pacearchaeota archaeon CG10_big_fil_rev_8_21_14_0_10_34_12]|nr:MAG: 50S ribosomal protein L10 [Candidatus Pacearchaeota archaeon CG10_big_fil_rev_8_21_14_0_10_34_12]